MPNASQTDPLLGRLIDGRYQVRSRIARGGMATVYLATDLRLERRVALKVMHSHLADDTNFKTRFVQEARSAARLAHPNVVNVFDQGQDDDMAYLVMEYLPGITLRDLLRDYGKLTPEQAIDIMESVLSGLAAAHKAGIVHRDLKPENVMLADDGRIKLGDFGLARAATAATGTGQALLGTIAYLSPELVTRGIADTRSDIYAVGIMLYEMLTGEQPFQGEQPMQIAYQHANDTVPRPSIKNPLVPPQLDELVLWATNRDPEKRPADARELLERLYEVERAVHAGIGADAGLDATMVIAPAASDARDTTVISPDALLTTQLSGPATQVRSEATATDAVSKLATVSRNRRGRGWWLFALVLLLAGAAAGTGWYFGSGPGALVAVPAVVDQNATQAVHKLKDAEFVVAKNPVYSCAASEGTVTASHPSAGTALHKGAKVTIDVSRGHKPNRIPKLGGLSVSDARAAIKKAKSLVGTTIDTQFNAQVPKDAVISATRAGDNNSDITNGGTYAECETVNLVVSSGPVPDVTGLPLAEAQKKLAAVGLHDGQGQARYDDTVPKGSVIAQTPADPSGPVRPGDTILLDVSEGPQLFAVPDVVGETWDKAKKELQSADGQFTLDYPKSGGPFGLVPTDSYASSFTVTKITPGANTKQRKGTKIKVELEFHDPDAG
ncbi:Stk1 family PASTA domain-containing Ser/Thr kinase [Gryllotalpicola ginsengisoli]|uniref:Stk1 family PASTA domain-containing Ser/Thr kinase n=1 Tax=Gryllotalpicola ginsengisoli TaxID=444608 RepID=UPI0003B362D2|nr:Stk1 family PASTA domain-containing Ser/Thr kinase [Gryllotalpicola ginsengisoli]